MKALIGKFHSWPDKETWVEYNDVEIKATGQMVPFETVQFRWRLIDADENELVGYVPGILAQKDYDAWDKNPETLGTVIVSSMFKTGNK